MTYDQFLAALAIWREARNQPAAAMLGVYWVIVNRAKRKYFGASIPAVILWPWQFSSFNATDPNVTKFPRPDAAADWTAWQQITTLVANPAPDPTGGALLYESIPDQAKRPTWADPGKLAARIGDIRFYHA